MMRNNQGFTIIELTLAMSFVAMLLIAVATLSIQLTNQYSRGLTLKEITQAGTEASNDIRRTISQAQLSGNGVQTITVDGGGTVLCTGSYSYIANDPANLNNPSSPNIIRVGASELPARLAKVRDLGGRICSERLVDDTSEKRFASDDVSELLSSGSRLLVVDKDSLTAAPNGVTLGPDGKPTGGVFAEAYKQGRAVYNVTLTIRTGVDSEFTDSKCSAPTEQESNLEFCAIDTFNFTARVGSAAAL